MSLKKPKFWDFKKPNLFSYILLPLALIFQILYMLKKFVTSTKKYPEIKSICIGNIYLGGTGKTSLSLKINQILKDRKFKTCFIKKNYSNQKDEQKILKNDAKLFKSHKRSDALIEAINEKYEYAIFDDGLQDVSITYDLNIVCFNSINLIGNGLTIHSGPLRNKLNILKKYNIVLINGDERNLEFFEEKILKINPKINIFRGKYIPLNLEKFNKNDKYLIFSGIGNHQTFVAMLKSYGINIVKDMEFPDHYYYKLTDIKNMISLANKLGCKILTTEKDFYRVEKYKFEEIKFVKSELKISKEENLTKIILNI